MSRFLKFVNRKEETLNLVNVDQIVSVSVNYHGDWHDNFRYPKTVIATTGDLGCLDYKGDLNHQIEKALRSEERIYVIVVNDLGYEEAKKAAITYNPSFFNKKDNTLKG